MSLIVEISLELSTDCWTSKLQASVNLRILRGTRLDRLSATVVSAEPMTCSCQTLILMSDHRGISEELCPEEWQKKSRIAAPDR